MPIRYQIYGIANPYFCGITQASAAAGGRVNGSGGQDAQGAVQVG
jgi:hypothetical protein